jgi:hypothetical protein
MENKNKEKEKIYLKERETFFYKYNDFLNELYNDYINEELDYGMQFVEFNVFKKIIKKVRIIILTVNPIEKYSLQKILKPADNYKLICYTHLRILPYIMDCWEVMLFLILLQKWGLMALVKPCNGQKRDCEKYLILNLDS